MLCNYTNQIKKSVLSYTTTTITTTTTTITITITITITTVLCILSQYPI